MSIPDDVPKVKVKKKKYCRVPNLLTHPLVEQPVYGQGVPYDGDHHQAWDGATHEI